MAPLEESMELLEESIDFLKSKLPSLGTHLIDFSKPLIPSRDPLIYIRSTVTSVKDQHCFWGQTLVSIRRSLISLSSPLISRVKYSNPRIPMPMGQTSPRDFTSCIHVHIQCRVLQHGQNRKIGAGPARLALAIEAAQPPNDCRPTLRPTLFDRLFAYHSSRMGWPGESDARRRAAPKQHPTSLGCSCTGVGPKHMGISGNLLVLGCERRQRKLRNL